MVRAARKGRLLRSFHRLSPAAKRGFLAFRAVSPYRFSFVHMMIGREIHMAERKDESEDEALRARLDKLSSALDAHGLKPDGPKAEQESGSIGTAMSLGFRVLTEFAAAVVVGALIGWQLDVW